MHKPTCYNCGKGNHYAKDCWAGKSERTKKWEARKNKGANSTEKGNSNNNNINNSHTERQIADTKDKGKGKAPETTKTANLFVEGSSTGNENKDFDMALLDAEFFDFGAAHEFTTDVSAIIAEANKCINHRHDIALLDSGANVHCTPYLDRLQNKRRGKMLTITSANSTQVETDLIGDMNIKIEYKGQISKIFLKEVYYVAEAHVTLISQGLLCDIGYSFLFSNSECAIYYQDKMLGKIYQRKNLYPIYEVFPK